MKSVSKSYHTLRSSGAIAQLDRISPYLHTVEKIFEGIGVRLVVPAVDMHQTPALFGQNDSVPRLRSSLRNRHRAMPSESTLVEHITHAE